MMAEKLWLSPPQMGGVERDLLLEAFDSNWIAPLGPFVKRFEEDMSRFLGCPAAVALSSGTAAIHLALILVGVGPGDRVICPSFTFAASANPIAYLGALPVFIDSDASTWNLDPALLREELEQSAARGRMPKAVIAVDLYGQCADYDAIGDLCGKWDIPLIEDAAEALGATYKGKPAGTLGRLGVLSFNGNKIITTSGGGMLLGHPAEIARARSLATQSRDDAPHYQHSTIGYNYRMSNLLAAVGVGQLRSIEQRVAKRQQTWQRYHEALGHLTGISFMPEAPYGVSNRWLTCITIDPDAFGARREDVRVALERENIEARPLWKPMHLQPVFAGCEVRGGDVCANLFEHGLCLPSGTAMSDADIERVSDVVRRTGSIGS